MVEDTVPWLLCWFRPTEPNILKSKVGWKLKNDPRCFFLREKVWGWKWWTMVADYCEGAKIRFPSSEENHKCSVKEHIYSGLVSGFVPLKVQQCFPAPWPTQTNYVPPWEEEQRRETSKGITDDDRREQEWRKVRRPVGCWIWSLQS